MAYVLYTKQKCVDFSHLKIIGIWNNTWFMSNLYWIVKNNDILQDILVLLSKTVSVGLFVQFLTILNIIILF